MARARNIKPSFFKNEILGEADPLLGLLFISLWTLADKAGRLEDRPLRIKAETFPYRENIDINGYLTQLLSLGFIDRYSVDGIAIIQIITFEKHQSPHSTEKTSELPSKPIDKPITVIVALNNESTNVDSNINVLIPDSLNTDSLIPDSPILIPEVCAAEKSAPPKNNNTETELQTACKKTWKYYSDAYWQRYKVYPIRNQKINTQVKKFVQRIGFDESPHVAAHYLQNNSAYYMLRGHAVDGLLADAEKLRTEWATGRTMTSTRARQIDKSESNRSAVDEAIELLEAR